MEVIVTNMDGYFSIVFGVMLTVYAILLTINRRSGGLEPGHPALAGRCAASPTM
jgi:hypothetical protein